MKKVLALAMATAALFLPQLGWAELSGTSMRMQGVNPDLVGIVADEHSDIFGVNPAELSDLEGWRVYTNLSNLYGGQLGSDRALDGTTTGGTGQSRFILGGLGNPLRGVLPDSRMGLLYDSRSSLFSRTNTMWWSGERTTHETSQHDASIPNDGDFADPGDWTEVTNKKAKREIKSGGTDYQVLYGQKLGGLPLKIGTSLSLRDSDIGGRASSTEPVTATDSYRQTIVGVARPTTKEASLDAKEENKNTSMVLKLGGRYTVNERLNVGGLLTIAPTSRERVRNSIAKFNLDARGAGADPIEAVIEAADGDQWRPLGGYPQPQAALEPITGNVRNGFDWTDGTDWGIFDADGWGATGDETGTAKASGTRISFCADTYYMFWDNLRLVGRIGFGSTPQKLSGSLALPYKATLRSTAGGVAGDRAKYDLKTTYDVSGDITATDFNIDLGGEAELRENVLLGFGLKYASSTSETKGDYTRKRNDVIFYDINANDDIDGADYRVTITDTDKGSFSQGSTRTRLQFPLGLEMKPWRRFAVRLGVTHNIATTKNTDKTKVTEDGLRKTVREIVGATITTHEFTPKTTAQETTTIRETTSRSTQYYYGVGYEWSENLVFDILGLTGDSSWTGGRTGILDIGAWRIGATLRF
ncbi:TPA: hypothetical protein DCX15_05615 [bacterium]|nr:hypothetical protein [bacterium]